MTTTTKTKQPTPLSTHALAAFLTWKQFDVMVLLKDNGALSTGEVSADLTEIREYDEKHGGAFYRSSHYSSCYSCLRTLERRQYVIRSVGTDSYVEWALTTRGHEAIDWMV